jgi:hypothetical protein
MANSIVRWQLGTRSTRFGLPCPVTFSASFVVGSLILSCAARGIATILWSLRDARSVARNHSASPMVREPSSPQSLGLFVSRRLHALVGSFLFLLCSTTIAYGQTCPDPHSGISVHAEIATIQGTSGSVVLEIQNTQSNAVNLDLSAGPFVNKVLNGIVAGTKTEFAAGDGGGTLPKAVSPGTSADILAHGN